MPDYEDHLKFGWIAHFMLTVIFIPALYLLGNPIELVFAVTGASLPVALFGSILPDVDHHSSNTNTLFRYALFISVVVVTTVTLSQYIYSISLLWMSVISSVPLFLSLGTIVSSSLLTGLLSLVTFRFIRPNHRGLTHTLPFVIITTVIVGAVTGYVYTVFVGSEYQYLVATIISAYYATGIVTHLASDGEIIGF